MASDGVLPDISIPLDFVVYLYRFSCTATSCTSALIFFQTAGR